MKRLITIAAVVAVLAASNSAMGQVVAYHHRSTAWGDYYAGASELVRARGALLRDEAAAAEAWVRVAAAQDQLWYQRAEQRYQVKQMQLNYQQAKLSARLDRREAENAEEQRAAMRLLASARRGGVQWPSAMLRPEYAGSVTLVESILRNWSPDNPASGDAYRRALATEAGVLRARIAANHAIDFDSRVDAVSTIKQLQLLADLPSEEAGASQVAMR